MKKYTNPKTLKGQDKINRINDLMGRMSTLNESTSLSEIDFVKKGPNGIVYGVIRENRNYFIKTTDKTSGTLVAEDFNYVGGIENKYDERYNSYAEALKHLNMKFDMLNESYGIETGSNLFESDAVEVKEANASGLVKLKETEVEGEPSEVPDEKESNPENEKIVLDEEPEDVDEQKKVIKVDVPTPEPTDMEAPLEDEVDSDPFGDDAGIEGDEDPFGGDEELEGDEDMGEDGDETTKKIQKYTGKIGQLLRDKDDPDAELDKYVINSIVSAIDWEEIPDEDVEDIIAKIEGEDEEDGEGDGFATDDEEVVDLDAEEGVDEDPFADEEELSESEEDEGEIKESKVFSKKQLMESFLKNVTKKSLKKVLKENRNICEECLGEGCKSCDMDEHHNMSHTNYGKHNRDEYMVEDDLMSEKLKGKQYKLDKNKNGRIDAEDFKMLRRGKKQYMEEDMDVLDSIATGQDYLSATGDLDRDSDQIPNRLDMDADGDGRLDFEMSSDDGEGFVELDFDSIMGTETPVKEPGTKEPTTRPGTGTDWDKIKRPQVSPKPKARRDVGDMPKPHRRSFRRKGMFR
jgi:hypothetical protein